MVFVHIIHRIMIPMVCSHIPMYNAYPFFPSKIQAKMCVLYLNGVGKVQNNYIGIKYCCSRKLTR